MPEKIWELPDVGNVELSEDRRSLVFRIEIKNEGSSTSYGFISTFDRKSPTKTLTNVEKDARRAGMVKGGKDLQKFMVALSRTMPLIFAVISKDDEEEDAAKEEQEKEKITLPTEVLEEAEREAERILSSPDPLGEADKHLAAMICGEEKNRQKLFLKSVAAKSKDPRLLWIALITGTEGSGKTTLQRIVEKTCRCKVVGRLTRHALDYMDLKNYDVLILKELGNTDKEDDGLSTIKFVSIDDNGYTVEVPWRDPDSGMWTTKTYRIPPINVLSSSTRVKFDPQFERRAEFINPDESEEQTIAVRKFKVQRERQAIQVKLGSRRYTEADFALAVIRAILAKIEDLDVEIPFAHSLDRAILSKAMRSRGDIDKLMTNVRAYHLLIQRSQFRVEQNGRKIIFASPQGAVRVIDLFRESFDAMLGGLTSGQHQ